MEAVHTLPVVAAIGDAHTLDELDALFVVVLRDREARKATAAAFETRAWALVESLVDASMAAIVRDTDALAAHRARTLDLLKRMRHLVGGRDRFALEMRFASVFAVSAKRHLACAQRSADRATMIACRGRDCGVFYAAHTRHVSCPVCQYRGCVQCGGASAHDDCADYAAALAELRAAGVEMKACPNCGTMVSKDGGCDRMRCEACLRQWDWTTGKTGKDLTIEHLWVKE